MMDVIGALYDAWFLVAGVVGLIVWFVRLESRVTRGDERNADNTQRIELLNAKHESLDSKVVEQLSEVRESLARIEGFLGSKSNS
jgi:hypothetical protein